MGGKDYCPHIRFKPLTVESGQLPTPSLVALAIKPENPLGHCAQAGFPVEGKEKE